MAERKGLLTAEQEKVLAELLDEAIKFNGLLETMDGIAFKLIIKTVDDNFAEKIPAEWQSPLEPLIDKVIEQDWAAAGELAAELLDAKIDIPGLDDASEEAIFKGAISMILGAILTKVKVELKMEE
jgi:hypothetical protein